MKLLGLDPGLRRTGWGLIEAKGNRLRYIAAGVISSKDRLSLAERLVQIHDGVAETIAHYCPDEAAVETVFVNNNPIATVKLCHARGVVLLVPARVGLSVSEYEPTLIKKTVVGTGHANKVQVALMVCRLLHGPGPGRRHHNTDDATDALAVAICHAHYRTTSLRLTAQGRMFNSDGAAGEPES